MRILLVAPWDQELGGVAFILENLARDLREQGHEVMFLHPGGSWRLRARTTKLGFPGFVLTLRWFISTRPLRSADARGRGG